jgi:hypothetical protein
VRVSEAIRIRELAEALLSDEQLAALGDDMEVLSRLGIGRKVPGAISILHRTRPPSDGVLGTGVEAAARRVMTHVREVEVDG